MSIDYLLILLLSITICGIVGLILAYLPTQVIQRWWNSYPLQKKNHHNSNTTTPAFNHEFTILYLLADVSSPYVGYELWQTLLDIPLIYGDFSIFHYYELTAQGQRRLFSVANAVEPGVFDSTDIGSISCPGLCLFMEIRSFPDPKYVFQCLLGVVKQLKEALGGTLCDENQQPFTKATYSAYQARLSMTQSTS